MIPMIMLYAMMMWQQGQHQTLDTTSRRNCEVLILGMVCVQGGKGLGGKEPGVTLAPGWAMGCVSVTANEEGGGGIVTPNYGEIECWPADKFPRMIAIADPPQAQTKAGVILEPRVCVFEDSNLPTHIYPCKDENEPRYIVIAPAESNDMRAICGGGDCGPMQAAPFDVPPVKRDHWVTMIHNCLADQDKNECEHVPENYPEMSCEDQSRFLLMSEDRRWHCLKLTPQ